MKFKIHQNRENWIALGICYPEIVINNKNKFRYYTIGHGVYAISSNGGSWSHHESSDNNCIKGFTFTESDVIEVKFEPTKLKVLFSTKLEKYELKIKESRSAFKFCAILYFDGD